MPYRTTLRGESFAFADLRELLACAGEEKSGDHLAGIAASSERRRVAAKLALADVPLGEIVDSPLIDDDVTAALLADLDRPRFSEIRSWTVGELREWVLSDDFAPMPRAILPEVAAAVCKLMGNKDLVLAASRIRVVTRCRNTMGEPGTFGVRVQPNHPADDVPGILLAALDGLSFGCGDAVIGVNPAAESIDSVAAILRGLDRLIRRLDVPTQHCCLAHISTQLAALERGARVDLLFRSVAGRQAALASCGTSLAQLREGMERVREHHATRPG